MTESMSFSFIIPIFNDVNKLEITLQSIAAVNAEEPFEVIIVDDDGPATNEKCVQKLLEGKNFKSMYLKKQNEGPFYARKLGVKHAQGDYIVFVDCGDAIFSDVFSEHITRFLRRHDVDVLTSDIISQESGLSYRKNILPEITSDDFAVLTTSAFFKKCNKNLLGTPGKIYSKDTLDRAFSNIELPPRVCNAEDLLLFTTSLLHARQVHHVNNYFYLYEIHQKSLSHDKQPAALQRRFHDKDCVADTALRALGNVSCATDESLLQQLSSFFRKYKASVRLHWVINFPSDFKFGQKIRVFVYYFLTGVFISALRWKLSKKQFDYD